MTIPHIARTAALILGFTIAAGATAALPALRDNAKIREAAQAKVVSMERQIAAATKSIEDVISLMATLDTLEGHQIALDMVS